MSPVMPTESAAAIAETAADLRRLAELHEGRSPKRYVAGIRAAAALVEGKAARARSLAVPSLAYASDVVVECCGDILLVDRGKAPSGMALVGGGVDAGETAREAAAREVWEETGIKVDPADLVHVPGEWDAPDRDPRRRTVTTAFLLRLDSRPDAVAGDDAASLAWVPVSSLDGLAFPDHADIIAAALAVAVERIEGTR